MTQSLNNKWSVRFLLYKKGGQPLALPAKAIFVAKNKCPNKNNGGGSTHFVPNDATLHRPLSTQWISRPTLQEKNLRASSQT